MATNLIYLGSPEKNREREVGADVLPGTPVIVDGKPAVTLTASGGTDAASINVPGGYTISGGPGIGGVGNRTNYATVAYDGTYEFTVAGVTTSTATGVAVYRTTAGGLTLTEGTNVLFGQTDFPPDYHKTAGKAPVRIGA